MAKRKKAGEPNIRPLTVYLLKESVKSFEKALDDPKAVEEVALKDGLDFTGVMYRGRQNAAPPAWKAFLREGTDDPLANLENQHQSVLLLVRPSKQKRILAFVFGYARALLKPSCYETDFGLKVVMNVVDPDKLRCLDASTLEEVPVQTKKQASRVSALEMFEVDPDADMLRALTGTPREILDDGTKPRLGKVVSGSAALAVRPNLRFDELGDLSKEILALYQRDDYKKHGFEWVDHLRQVRDKDLVEKLDGLLLKTLQKKDAEKVTLAPPEVLDWERFGHLHFSCAKDEKFDDFRIEDFYAAMGDASSWTVQRLRQTTVVATDASADKEIAKHPLHRSLVFDTVLKGERYLLTNGLWFCLDTDFAKTVETFLAALEEASVGLPPFDKTKHKTEGGYTTAVCKGTKDFAHMDRKLVRPTNGRTDIEVCDIFTAARQFVHIKPYKGSSTLSHLLAQGSVSADLFQGDYGFREAARKQVAKSSARIAGLFPKAKGIAKVANFEVVFAVIKKKPKAGTKWQHTLPFFAQLHLMQSAKLIQSKSYKVSVKLIEQS